MPTLYPSLQNASFATEAERNFAKNLEASLDDEFAVICNFSFLKRENETLREGEADFLLLHPTHGLLVIELKGGVEIGIDQETGSWYSVSRNGYRNIIKNPAEQARRNMHSVLDIIRKSAIDLRNSIPFTYGYAVCFPYIRFEPEVHPADLPPDIVIDLRHLANADSRILQILSYWRRNPDNQGLDHEWYYEIVHSVLLPEFRIVKTFKQDMETGRSIFALLTGQQSEIIKSVLSVNREVEIRGYAGTGKTVIACHIAESFAEKGKRVLFLCYNKNLAADLKKQLSRSITADNYHSFANMVIKKTDPERWVKNPTPDFWKNEVPLILMDVAHKYEKYDILVIDEGQDFPDDWIESLRSFLKPDARFFRFMDEHQDIYGQLENAGMNRLQYPLTKNCRSTVRISEKTAHYGQVTIEQLAENIEGEDVQYFEYEDEAMLRNQIAEQLRFFIQQNNVKNESVILLSPHSYENTLFQRNRRVGGYQIVQYNSGKLKNFEVAYSTVKGFKGLESDIVFVFGFEKSAMKPGNKELYVACSRARLHLRIFVQKNI